MPALGQNVRSIPDERQVQDGFRTSLGPPFPSARLWHETLTGAETLQVNSSWVTAVMGGLESIGQYTCITAKM